MRFLQSFLLAATLSAGVLLAAELAVVAPEQTGLSRERLGRIDALMKRVKELEMPAVAMTDHGNLYGAIDFYMAAKKAKVKSILGCEAYLAPGSMLDKKEVTGRKRASHLTLLAASNEGFTDYYDLPNETAYAETCASVGLAMWASAAWTRSAKVRAAGSGSMPPGVRSNKG